MNYHDPEIEKEYKHEYYLRNREKLLEKAKSYYNNNKEKKKEYSNRYYYENDVNFSDKRKQYRIEYRQKIKRKALSLIDPRLKCVRCGCDDLRFIEKNHKNGGGNKESKSRGRFTLCNYEIINGIRKTDDLELLCKPCNHIHYLEKKFKINNTGLNTVWNKQKLNPILIKETWRSN